MAQSLTPLEEVLVQNTQYISVLEPREYPKLSVKLYGRGVELDSPVDAASVKMVRHQLAKPGQVIVSEIWAKKGAIGLVPQEGAGALCTSHFFLFDVNEKRVHRGWLQALFRANYLGSRFDEEAKGTTTYAAIRPKHFLAAEIPLPPLAEQQRMVARIERLAAKIGEARVLRQRALEEPDALLQSALSRALPRDVPAPPLTQVIATGSKISYGVLVPGPDVEDGIPFVRVQDLAIDNPQPSPAKRISPEVDAQYARTRLRGGEVLVGVVGSIGKVGVAPGSWAGANIARAVCRIVPGHNVETRYLAAVLSSSQCQEFFKDATRTLAQPTLNVALLSQVPIPLPPIAEQRRIVAYLDGLQTKVDRLKALQAQTRAELDALLPSILDRAFNGEL